MTCNFNCQQGRTCSCAEVGDLPEYDTSRVRETPEPELWELILGWICIALASATAVGICAFFAGVLINHLFN